MIILGKKIMEERSDLIFSIFLNLAIFIGLLLSYVNDFRKKRFDAMNPLWVGGFFGLIVSFISLIILLLKFYGLNK